MSHMNVRLEIAFHKETTVGALLTITTRVPKLGCNTLACHHEVSDSLTAAVHASAQMVAARFDLNERQPVPLEEAARERAALLEASSIS